MAKIKIRISEPDESYEQYQFLESVITLDGKEFVLDTVCLNTDDEEEDLELLESFGTQWEIIAGNEKLEFEVDKEVDNMALDFENFIEQKEIDEDKTMKRCQN